ncbi:RNA polymerase I enhancer binding protein [Puttea exsequens]|nr:RNA polymerase I enhancer binding protein [Puttea exsequens]
MGQSSSQLEAPPAEENAEVASMGKKRRHKSKKGKGKSADDVPMDEDTDGAKALLQLRGEIIGDKRAPYFVDPSREAVPHSGHLHTDNAVERHSRKSLKGKKRDKQKSTRKGAPKHPFDLPISENMNTQEAQSSPLPSTPPRQMIPSIESSEHLQRSHSAHALDDVSTDDEAVAQFEQEYGKASDAATAAPDEDEETQSQQLSLASHQVGLEMLEFDDYDLYAQKSKKRKRHTTPPPDESYDDQSRLLDEKGQHILDADVDFEAFDKLFGIDLNFADPYAPFQVDDMLIDPELHSMSQLRPAINLSALAQMDNAAPRRQKKQEASNGILKPSKRRRVIELHDGNVTNVSYQHPISESYDQENVQDNVLPGYEDSQRGKSLGVGSPSMETLAHKSLEYMGNTSKSKKAKGRMTKGDLAGNSANGSSGGKERRETIHGDDYKPGKGGQWTNAEALKLDRFRENFCEANNITVWQFNDRVQSTIRGNNEVKVIFDEIKELFPYRPGLSVQKFCRRRYHNFPARGSWSADDDDMLRNAVAEKGSQWKIIGQLLDRMGEDCRDRYRNYILNAENRNHEQWTEEEVRELGTVALGLAEDMREDRRAAKRAIYGDDIAMSDSDSDQLEEDLKTMDFQAVSDRMGGRRSRLQCSTKWKQLERQMSRDTLKSMIDGRGIEGRRLEPKKNPWRWKKSQRKVVNMQAGDMHALVQAILDSGVPTEGNIPWKALGDDKLRAMWNSTDKRAAWAQMKKDVPDHEFLGYREITSQLLMKIEDKGDQFERRWDPEVDGYVGDSEPRRRSKRRDSAANEGEPRRQHRLGTKKSLKARRVKSTEFVQDSDEEDGAHNDSELRRQNGSNTLPGLPDDEEEDDASEALVSTITDEDRRPIEDDAEEDDDAVDSLFDESISPQLAKKVQLLRGAA